MEGAIHIQLAPGRPWVEPYRERLRELGLGYEPVCGELELAGTDLLAALETMGAVAFEDLPISWSFRVGSANDGMDEDRSTLRIHGTQVTGFGGAFLFGLEGARYSAAVAGHGSTTVTLLAAPSLQDLAGLVRRIQEADAALRRQHLQVYGGEGYGLSRRRPEGVAEERIILPERMKRDLLSYVDAFGRSARDGAGGPASRGVLFLGRPGTGKTMMARHILQRLDGWRKYLFVRATAASGPFDARNFEQMVHAIDCGGDPAVVLIEDLDRMFEGGATTPQYFLNVLDGLLEPSVPVLWLATSNDPGDIAQNLTDRPGRFDRVFLFPQPDAAQRTRLFDLYAPSPLGETVVTSLAEAAEGLTGAHIREICRSADLRRDADAVSLGDALWAELERMSEQHRESRDYGKALRGTVAGFGRR